MRAPALYPVSKPRFVAGYRHNRSAPTRKRPRETWNRDRTPRPSVRYREEGRLSRPNGCEQARSQVGLKADVFGHAGLAPSRAIVSPDLWQIELIGHRQAGVVVRNRQRHCHLAVRLFAKLSAVLVVNPN